MDSTERKLDSQKAAHDGFYFLALLFKNKWFILLFTLIVTIASVIYSLNMKIWYASTVNVVPPQSSGSLFESALGNVSSLLKDIGISKLKGGSETGYSFMVILQSRTMIDSMINKYNLIDTYDIEDSLMSLARKEFLEHISITNEKDGNYTVTIWDTDKKRAAVMTNDFIRMANDLAMKIYHEESGVKLDYIEKRLLRTDSTINAVGVQLKDFSKKNFMFSPEEQVKAVSISMAELQAELLQKEIMYDYYKENMGENHPYTYNTKQLLDQTKSKINEVKKQPGFAGNFALEDISELGIQYMKLYTKLETYTKLKAFLMPVYEQVSLDAVRNTQNLFVVDEAVPADKKDKPKRAIIVIGAGAGAFAFSVLIILLINGFKNFKRRYKEIDISL